MIGGMTGSPEDDFRKDSEVSTDNCKEYMANRVFKVATLLAAALAVTAGALDKESYRYHDRLISIRAVSAPSLFEDAVIFTAPAAARSVGIAFAHEGFGKVHLFDRLVVKDRASSGPLVYVYEVPANLKELEYRLVVDGLWTCDPWNPQKRIDPTTGLSVSTVSLPMKERETVPSAIRGLHLLFEGQSGESVTVGGSFNSWDPFMYELPEVAPGRYELYLPLPPGIYQYVYFYRGERKLDAAVPRKVYAKNGLVASEVTVR